MVRISINENHGAAHAKAAEKLRQEEEAEGAATQAKELLTASGETPSKLL
ncbi:hypothetical protein [Paucibacter sp. KBW04]|nr:hypothetical protein [Paucibacter sp. KBW04]